MLTAGRRPGDLRAAVDSLLRQVDVETDVVVVGNGCRPEGVPDGARVVALGTDEGIPAGRNAGVAHVEGELLFFLDDDARLAAPDTLSRVARAFEADPGWAWSSSASSRWCRGGARSRDWIPRLRNGDPARSSDITVVWEGAVGIRRAAFEQAGGWPAPFRFVHEGVDLGWRVLDAGWRIRYAGRRGGPSPVADRNAARVLLLFRCAQPSVARTPLPAAAAGRALRELVRAADRPAAEVPAGGAGGGARLP